MSQSQREEARRARDFSKLTLATYLEGAVIADKGCESGEGLLAAAADADEQSVTPRLPNDPANPQSVSQSVAKENQIHAVTWDEGGGGRKKQTNQTRWGNPLTCSL